MTSVADELMAMREIFSALEPLDKEARLRAMRWVASALSTAPVLTPTVPDYELQVAKTEATERTTTPVAASDSCSARWVMGPGKPTLACRLTEGHTGAHDWPTEQLPLPPVPTPPGLCLRGFEFAPEQTAICVLPMGHSGDHARAVTPPRPPPTSRPSSGEDAP